MIAEFFNTNCCLIVEWGDLAFLVPGSLLNALWNIHEWGRPSWPPGTSSPLLSGSICQQGQIETNTDIDLDKQASQDPIITGHFNQLMPVQLPFNLYSGLSADREGRAILQ